MSTSEFDKEAQRYRSDPVETPYLRAQQEWDQRIGNARVQAKNWRLAALLSLLLSLCLMVLVYVVLSLHKDTLFVAQVEKSGRVVNVAPLNRYYKPTQAQTEYFVTQFIQLIRNLPMDPVVARQDWMKAYQFTSRRGSQQLNQFMRQANVIKMLGKKNRSC